MNGIKKTSLIKNKFNDSWLSCRIEEKVPQEADLDMEMEEQKETDLEMIFEDEVVTI